MVSSHNTDIKVSFFSVYHKHLCCGLESYLSVLKDSVYRIIASVLPFGMWQDGSSIIKACLSLTWFMIPGKLPPRVLNSCFSCFP